MAIVSSAGEPPLRELHLDEPGTLLSERIGSLSQSDDLLAGAEKAGGRIFVAEEGDGFRRASQNDRLIGAEQVQRQVRQVRDSVYARQADAALHPGGERLRDQIAAADRLYAGRFHLSFPRKAPAPKYDDRLLATTFQESGGVRDRLFVDRFGKQGNLRRRLRDDGLGLKVKRNDQRSELSAPGRRQRVGNVHAEVLSRFSSFAVNGAASLTLATRRERGGSER